MAENSYGDEFGNQQITIGTQPDLGIGGQNMQVQGGNPPQSDQQNNFSEKVLDNMADKAAQSASETLNKTWIEKYLCCLDFLKKYFNITSNDFFQRFLHSLIPCNPKFQPLIVTTPDLYGPFWIFTTLILAIASAGSITKFIQGNSTKNFFQKFIPVAAGIIYGVGFLLPIILGLIMKCFGSLAPIPSIICTYGYSYSIFIPVVILCVIPSQIVQWCVLAYACFSSTSLLCVAYWKELGNFVANKRYIIIAIVLICQIGIFLMFKLYFFERFSEELSDVKKEEPQPEPVTNTNFDNNAQNNTSLAEEIINNATRLLL